MSDAQKLRFVADWHDRQSMRTIPVDYISDLHRISANLEKAPSDENLFDAAHYMKFTGLNKQQIWIKGAKYVRDKMMNK